MGLGVGFDNETDIEGEIIANNIIIDNIQIKDGAINEYFLQSDAVGNAIWYPAWTPSYGEIYWTSNTNTTIISKGIYTKALGISIIGNLSNFTVIGDNRLRYDGVKTNIFNVCVSSTIEPSYGRKKEVGMKIAKNGILEEQKIVATTDSGIPIPLTLNINISLSTNDYIELYVTTQNDDSNIDVIDMNMTINTLTQ